MRASGAHVERSGRPLGRPGRATRALGRDARPWARDARPTRKFFRLRRKNFAVTPRKKFFRAAKQALLREKFFSLRFRWLLLLLYLFFCRFAMSGRGNMFAFCKLEIFALFRFFCKKSKKKGENL